MSDNRVFVGLGSNVGDRLEHLRAAVAALRSTSGVEVVRTSSVYETAPVGPDQPLFLNAVVELRTGREARRLLERLKGIERELGRTPGPRWGPREIDLDLLVYGQDVIDEEAVRVPHPELGSRAFVLVPLAEIAPDVDVPGLGVVSAVAERVSATGVRLVGALT